MATVSQSYIGDPEVSKVEIDTRKSTKRRVLLGWNHQDDTPQGLRQGKIWCWTSESPNPKFQVFDQEYNRSPKAGEYRSAGVANFTMVRMFHRYWTSCGGVPRDMDPADKRRCRQLYTNFMRSSRISEGHPVDDDPENPIQPPPPAKRRKISAQQQETGRICPPGIEEELPGGRVGSPLFVDEHEGHTEIISSPNASVTNRPEEVSIRIDGIVDANGRIRPITVLDD